MIGRTAAGRGARVRVAAGGVLAVAVGAAAWAGATQAPWHALPGTERLMALVEHAMVPVGTPGAALDAARRR